MLQEITIHDLVLAIIAVFVLVLLLIVSVLFYSLYKYRMLHNRQIWKYIIENKITESIIMGQDSVVNDEAFGKHLQQPAFRILFLDLLVSSERKFSGSAREEIGHLFDKFQLEKEAWNNLKKKRAYRIAGGIQELTAMRVKPALATFRSLLAHPSKQVYQEAQYGIVSFNGFEGLDFLDTLIQPLSDWQQLRLLNSITEISNPDEGNMNLWLASPNPTVVIFTLRLMRKFQLLSFYNTIADLLKHNVVAVQIQVVRTLQFFENNDTINQLMNAFPHHSLNVQLEILKALKISKSAESEGFLKEQLWEHPINAVKISAAEVLVSLGQRQYLQDMALDKQSPDQFKQIINHALQEKIC